MSKRLITNLAIFVLACLVGYGTYKLVKKDKEDPIEGAFYLQNGTESQKIKVIKCPITYNSFESIADTTIYEQSISFVNFKPKTIRFVDIDIDHYLSPTNYKTYWKGKKKPTIEDLKKQVTPFLKGARIDSIVNINYHKWPCYNIELPNKEYKVVH